MGDLIRFQREKAVQAEIEFHGLGERYRLQAHTATGANLFWSTALFGRQSR